MVDPDLALETLLNTWDVHGPIRAERLIEGTNNLSLAVHTSCRRYVMRIYARNAPLRRLRFEHALLGSLGAMPLSFDVPVPIAAGSGDTLVETGDGRLAALFPFLPGRHAYDLTLKQVRAMGAVVGELDVALARIDLGGETGEGTILRRDRLAGGFGVIPEPLQMVAEVPLSVEQGRRLRAILERLLDIMPSLYAGLQQQLLHRDIDGGNLLMEGDRITAILDFEFAGREPRPYEIAAPMMQFSRSAYGTLPDWEPVRAFAEGYRDWVPLSHVEAEALPDLLRLWRAGTLIHREVIRRQGQATMEDVIARARGLLRIDEWMKNEGEMLVEVFAG